MFSFMLDVIFAVISSVINLIILIFGVRMAVVIFAITICYFCGRGIRKLAIF